MKIINAGVTAPKGFKCAGLRAGVKPGKTNKDMAMIVSEVPAKIAGTFTKNIVKAAPVLWGKKIVEEQEANMLKVSAMIINIITLVICIIFTLYNNIASYKNKMRWKYTFFYRMGMNKVKMKRHLNREILLTTEIACISSIPFAFIMVLIKILYKDLSIYWTIRYIGESLLVVVVLTIVIHFMVYGMANNVKKQIERSIQNEQ